MKHSFWSLIVLLSFITACVQKPNSTGQVTVYQQQVPVLINETHNPVLCIKIDGDSTWLGKILQGLELKTSIEGQAGINDIYVFKGKQDSTFRPAPDRQLAHGKAGIMTFSDTISSLPHYIWISADMDEKSKLTARMDIEITSLLIDGKPYEQFLRKDQIKQRLGIAVRKHRQDAVHTSRIPGLVTAKDGSLLAIFDVRYESSRDLQGHMDIGLHRSIDGGQTWLPLQIPLDMGTWGGLPEKYNGVSDACILVDDRSGDIYIAGLWMHGVINEKGNWIKNLDEDHRDWNHQWRDRGSQPGFGVKQTSQFLITKSTDNGLSWSAPVNLTTMCKKEEWWLWAPAPGHGITLQDGTLVMPTQGRDKEGLPFSNITYSKDRGQTWTTSAPAYSNTTECTAVELNDGSIMLNMRDNRNRSNKSSTNGRAICTTKDLGNTWQEHSSSHGALREPVCMASLHRHDGQLYFSNPNDKYGRRKITVKRSDDQGVTWPETRQILLDAGYGRGYSCLTSIDANTIGILYESSRADMVFQVLETKEFTK